MIRHNFRSSPWAAQAPLPADAPSPPSPSPPREFPSGPVHQKAILCLTEMDIDPIAMQLYRAAREIASADFCSWPVASPGPRVPSVHPAAAPCHGSRHGLSRVLSRVSRKKTPVKCGLSRCHGSRGRVYTPPHLAGAHSRQHATRYRPLDPFTSGSLPPSGSWVVSGSF